MDAIRGLKYVQHDFGDSPMGRLGGRHVAAEKAAVPRASGLTKLAEKMVSSLYNAVLDKANPARVDANARVTTRALSDATGELLGLLSQGSRIDMERAAACADRATEAAAVLLGSVGDAGGNAGPNAAVLSERLRIHLRNLSPAQMSTLQDGLQSLNGTKFESAQLDSLQRLVRHAVADRTANNLLSARDEFKAAVSSVGDQLSPTLLTAVAQQADAYARAHSASASQLLPGITTQGAWALLEKCSPGTSEAALVATHLQLKIKDGAITREQLDAQPLPLLRQAIDGASPGSVAYRTLAQVIFEQTGAQASPVAAPLADSFLRSVRALLAPTDDADLMPKTRDDGSVTSVCLGFLKDSGRAIYRFVDPQGRMEVKKFESAGEAETCMVDKFGSMAMDLSKLANQGMFAYSTRDFDPDGLAAMAPPSEHSPIKLKGKDLELIAQVAPTIYTFLQRADGGVTLKAETARLLVAGYTALDVAEVEPGKRAIVGGFGDTPTSCDPVGTHSYFSAEFTMARGDGALSVAMPARPVLSYKFAELSQPGA
jgi:hypothetical protein